MKQVNVVEAKARLSALLRDVAGGDEVIITSHGRPVARLSGVERRIRPRTYGALRQIAGRASSSPADVATALAPMTDAELEADGWT